MTSAQIYLLSEGLGSCSRAAASPCLYMVVSQVFLEGIRLSYGAEFLLEIRGHSKESAIQKSGVIAIDRLAVGKVRGCVIGKIDQAANHRQKIQQKAD